MRGCEGQQEMSKAAHALGPEGRNGRRLFFSALALANEAREISASVG